MGSSYPELFRDLQAPFEEDQCGTVAAGGGFQASYSPPRVFQNRLDEVMGPENWSVKYKETAKGIKCKLTLRFPDGSKCSKWDVGGCAGMEYKDRQGSYQTDDENDVKSGYSDAFKRACVAWGIGRCHYFEGVPSYVRDDFAASPFARKFLVSKLGKQNGHSAPAYSAPQTNGHSNGNGHSAPQPNGGKREFGKPQFGRQFYPWVKGQEETSGMPNLVKSVTAYAQGLGHPFKSNEWPDAFIPDAVAFVERLVSGATDQTPQARPQAAPAPAATNGGQNYYGHLETLLNRWNVADECSPDDRLVRRTELVEAAYEGLVLKKKIAPLQGASEEEKYDIVDKAYAANKLALNAIFAQYMRDQGVAV